MSVNVYVITEQKQGYAWEFVGVSLNRNNVIKAIVRYDNELYDENAKNLPTSILDVEKALDQDGYFISENNKYRRQLEVFKL